MPVEFLILANHVEVQNGLLYVSGGGWSEHWRVVPPDSPAPPTKLGIGVSILTPWNDHNRRQQLTVTVEHEDGGDPLAKIEGEIEVGRPPGLASGQDLRSAVAVNIDPILPKAGGYRIVAKLDDGEGEGKCRSVSFRVHDQAPPMVAFG